MDIKTKLGALGLWLVVFLAPIQTVLGAIFFMCLLDVVVGVWAAAKRKEAITSFKFRQTVPKLLGYVLTVLAVFVFQRTFAPSLLLVNSVGGFICATELFSISESLTTITGLPLLDKIKALLQPPKLP